VLVKDMGMMQPTKMSRNVEDEDVTEYSILCWTLYIVCLTLHIHGLSEAVSASIIRQDCCMISSFRHFVNEIFALL